jgi:membrane protein YqaA with SNARE-associated domain
LFLLAILDSAGLPVVGGVDFLLVAIAANRPDQAYWAALCAIAGSLLGSSVLFGIARKGGEVLLARYIASRRGARMHAWFERYGLVTVFIPALSPLPLPMKIPVFCAGALEVRWSFFLGVVLAARTLRYFALAFLGLRYGQMTFSLLRSHLWLVILLALGLAVVALLVLRVIEGPERTTEGIAVDSER